MISAPDVDFYGDPTPWPISELVYSEAIVERSAMHDWTIRPHRHNDLVQLFLLLEGSGQVRLDDDWHAMAAPSLLLIPQRVVHEIVWDQPSNGYVLSIRATLIEALTRRIEPLRRVFGAMVVTDVAESLAFLESLFIEIHDESIRRRPFKDLSLESLLRVLAIWLARHATGDAGQKPPASRPARHYARFARLVDGRHKLHWSVADYARALGITPSHLNTVCKQLAGKTALEVVHERLCLAARRELAYTERNVAGVAHRLGFDDPSYFTRFFKRETGMTPGEFRRRSGTHDAYGQRD